MVYTYNDIDRFRKEIEDLKRKGLIRDSKSLHSCPAFIVRNHVEIKIAKVRMVINYKKLNDNTKRYGYFVPNK